MHDPLQQQDNLILFSTPNMLRNASILAVHTISTCDRSRGGCQNLGGAKYATRTYFYGEKLCSYGVIAKVEGASAPPAPLLSLPCVTRHAKINDRVHINWIFISAKEDDFVL